MDLDLHSSLLRPFERLTAPGTTPGTVVNVPEEPAPILRVIAFSDSHIVDEEPESLDSIPQLVDQFAVTWINVDGLGDANVVQQLGEIFGLHRLALEDVVNVHQRPKVEDYGDYLFIVARMIIDGEQLQTEQICFFVGQNFVVTFQEGAPGDCLDPVRDRLQRTSGRLRNGGTDYLTYALLDSIIDHYFPVVESYGEKLDALEDLPIDGRKNSSIAAIHRIRSELLFLRRVIRPHREAIHQLLRDSHVLFGEETRLYLRDCYDHTMQLSDVIDTYRETCSDLRDFHLSAVGNRTNEVMKTLTIIATIFIPLSFIAGLYGMNFDQMPELHWQYGYAFALMLMGGVVSTMLLWFRRKGWFDD